MFSKSVKSGSRPFRKRVSNRRKDRRVFSKTADGTDKINCSSGRPMRGGIRL